MLNIDARISPVAKNAPIGPGNVHGATVITLLIKPRLVAIHANMDKTIGTNTNGIISTGFSTIGAPNITGSFILNIAGI